MLRVFVLIVLSQLAALGTKKELMIVEIFFQQQIKDTLTVRSTGAVRPLVYEELLP